MPQPHSVAQMLLAWLTASTTNHGIPSAVSEKLSVGSDKMKGHYIRTLGKVVDEADIVLLMLDAHDTTLAAANWSRSRCSTRLTRCRANMFRHSSKDLRLMIPRRPSPPCVQDRRAQHFIVGHARLPERRQSKIINTLERIRWATFFPSCSLDGDRYDARAKFEPVTQTVDSPGNIIDTDEGIQGQKRLSMLLHNVVKPEDVDDPTSDHAFPPILVRLHHFPPHVAEIRARGRTEELLEIDPSPIFNTTPQENKNIFTSSPSTMSAGS
ncbi:hypothetical protein EDB92DRAFT_1943016 [Lactarius akahatsu]|uniref:Uncharacterized protein n=1 Tax=Lactarius akahatsu TaxID=416441 RepID=A0AAD4LK63_9AGAM|nr:hypothetical protein EDB92DRAFT_1943016 [Lactarius akahatsu]